MFSKKIGDQVTVGGKTYTVSGFHKRSYLLTREGKEYKCGPEKLDRIEKGLPPAQKAGAAARFFEHEIRMSALFGSKLEHPSSLNALSWIEKIDSQLSPENLTCDGEMPPSRVAAKARELHAARIHCENLLGRSVPATY